GVLLDGRPGQGGGEDRPELPRVVQRPAPELPARGHDFRRHVAAGRGVGGVDRLADVARQFAEDVGTDVLDELIMAAEVPVERGRGHAHLAGDRAQRHRVGALGDQDPAGRLLDLLWWRGPDAAAAPGCLHPIDLRVAAETVICSWDVYSAYTVLFTALTLRGAGFHPARPGPGARPRSCAARFAAGCPGCRGLCQ